MSEPSGTRQCQNPECRERIVGRRADARYCSATCRSRASRARRTSPARPQACTERIEQLAAALADLVARVGDLAVGVHDRLGGLDARVDELPRAADQEDVRELVSRLDGAFDEARDANGR